MKKITFFIVLTLSILLSGCIFGSNETQKEVDFDNFSIKIQKSFEKTSSSSIENKQIIGKIIKSFQMKSENENNFKTNLLISKTSVKDTVENFGKANISKIQKKVPGYNKISMKEASIKCNESKIESKLHSFSMPKEIFNSDKKYFISQYYFKYKDKGYILSYATNNKDNLQNFESYTNTISCN